MKPIMIKVGVALACLLSALTGTAQNTLSVSDFTAAAGKEVSVPLYLTCSDAVVGAQFDVELPFAKSGSDATLVTTRSDGHTVSLRKLSDTKYTVVVLSLRNNALRGNSGLLMRFPMRVADDAQADDTFPVKLSGIVLSDRTGRNVAAEREAEATFTVLRTPTPDFVVTGLKILNAAETLVPGGRLQLGYNVVNQGTGESGAGWTENIYLEDAAGNRSFVGQKTYPNTLAEGTTLPRIVETDIPKVARMDGTVRAYLEIVNQLNTGELIADQGNNSTLSENTATLGKRIFFDSERMEIGEGKRSRATLTRSGDWSTDETFALEEYSDHGVRMLDMPQEVTIPAGQSAAYFYITATDNDGVNPYYRTNVRATGDGYGEAGMAVDVEDDDSHPLALTADKAVCTEGGTLTLTVAIGKALETDLRVTLTNTATARFSPSVRSITIPAGATTASATTTVADNNTPEPDVAVTFTATATGYGTASCYVTLNDNDRPQLSMTLSRDIISEADGYGAAMATITRSGSTEEGVTVFVTSDSGGSLYFDSNKNRIPAGSSSITVPVSVEDNSMQDGQRQWKVTAALVLSDNSRVGAGSPSYCEAAVTVTDDDTDNVLKLSSRTGQVVEGGGTCAVTIRRNSTAGALTVSLASDDTRLVFPPTVTIAEGQTEATFTVSAKANTSVADDSYSCIRAAAEGWQPASFTFLVSDRTLPDAAFEGAPRVETDTPFGGQAQTVTLYVRNTGLATLPAGVPVEFYLSTDRNIRISLYHTSPMELVASGTTAEAVPAGETRAMTFDVTVPEESHFGRYYLFAWLNRDGGTEELSDADNRSATVALDIVPQFTLAELTTDRRSYQNSGTVMIGGRMSNGASGLPMDGRTPEVYLVSASGSRTASAVTLDAAGRFSCAWPLTQAYGGLYAVGACCTGAGLTDGMAEINVWKMAFDRSYLKLTLTEGVASEGDINVTNMSGEALHDVAFSISGLPDGWQWEMSEVKNLAAGAASAIHYKVTPASPSTGNKYAEATIEASGTDGDGGTVTAALTTLFYSFAATGNLQTASGGGIVTTLARDGRRSYSLALQNTGVAETGAITVTCASESAWLSAVSTSTLPSIAPEGTAQLTLQLTYQSGMIVDGTYKSYVKLTPENGKSLVVPVTVTVVGTDVSELTVDVVDVYSLAEEGGPHVSDATVRLTNALTGEVALTGKTGADGRWTTDVLKEGTYYVYVTADSHNYAEKTVTVGPGEKAEMQVFLPYKAVNVTYTVEETTVVDEYRTVVEMTFVPDIPQAVVVPTLPGSWGCGHNAYSIRLTNKGRLTAYSPYMQFPNIDGYTFRVLSDYPAVIYPGESCDVTVEYDGPEDRRESAIGGIVMHYSYMLQGELYSSAETYAAMVGCQSMPYILPGGGLGGDGDDANYGGADIPDIKVGELEDDDMGTPEMPDIKIRDYTQSDDNSVLLKFEQRFLLTRQAFKGTLVVENAQTDGIKDITVEATVKTLDGQDATDLFAIEYDGDGDWGRPLPEGGNEGNGTWLLDADRTGTATVLYVPSKDAAPAESTDYLFGGHLTYRDIGTGALVEVELMQTRLTVNPSPDLHLTYFIQRDFISDDPLTEEVEPWEPAEFALLIQNKGAGPALDLKIETSSPQVVDNVNGLPVTFTSLYTTVDGREGTLPFNSLDLGRIEAGQNVMARWWFYSNVSGYVADYNVTMTKCSNYGADFNLITLDGVKELTRSVCGTIGGESGGRAARKATAVNTGTQVFLLNEIEDEDDLPDYVVDADGNGTDDLEIVSGTTSAVATDEEGVYELTVSSTRGGWVYAEIHDPTNCTMELVKVTRGSDGADMTSNFWQTGRTMRKDRSVIYENVLHLADNIGGAETYTLTYGPKPAPAPQVESIGLTGNGIALRENAIREARITFHEPIDGGTMDADDVVLMCGSRRIGVTVEKASDDDRTFAARWSGEEIETGDYVLTVFTAGVKNKEGRSGGTTRSVAWSQRILDAETYLRGDANGDGKVDATDVTLVRSHVADSGSAAVVEDNADANLDGKVDGTDVTEITSIATLGHDATATDTDMNKLKTEPQYVFE